MPATAGSLPYGMAGGSPGALGQHYLERTDGSVVAMAGADSVEAQAGDVLVVDHAGRAAATARLDG